MPKLTTRYPPLCVAVLLIAAASARAQDSRPEPNAPQPRIYGAEGYYLGVSGIYALGIADLPGVGDVEGSGGANLRIGHRFNRWLANEIHLEWLNDFAYEGGGFTAWDLMFSERLYLIEGRFQPFAVAGFGVIGKRDHGGGDSRRGYGFGGRFGSLMLGL